MTTQILERPGERRVRSHAQKARVQTARTGGLHTDFNIDAERDTLTRVKSEFIDDRDELGQRIMQSAMSNERDTIAVKCRSVSQATNFATPMRSMLLTLTSGFDGISVTVSPSLNLNTWPAMDSLVSALEEAGAGENCGNRLVSGASRLELRVTCLSVSITRSGMIRHGCSLTCWSKLWVLT